jgi:hypothetical protein
MEMTLEELERFNDVLNFLNIPRDNYEHVGMNEETNGQQIAIEPILFMEILMKIAEFQMEIANAGASEMMAAMERTRH